MIEGSLGTPAGCLLQRRPGSGTEQIIRARINLWSSADLHGRWLNICFPVPSEVWGINSYLEQVDTQEEVEVTSRENERGTGGHGR